MGIISEHPVDTIPAQSSRTTTNNAKTTNKQTSSTMTTMTKMIGAASLLALVSTQASALNFDQRRIPLEDTSSVSDLEAQTYQAFSDFRDAVSSGLNVDLSQVGDVVWTVGVEDPTADDPTVNSNVISTVFELSPASGPDAFTDDEVSKLKELLQAGEVGTY